MASNSIDKDIKYSHFQFYFLCRPEIFKHDLNERITSQQENEIVASDDDEDEDDDDDGLPPLEANTNRIRPVELQVDENLESNSDTDDYVGCSHSST